MLATETLSDIELLIRSRYTAFGEHAPLTTAHLREAAATRPLATLMAERVTALRDWASTRTVPAN